MSSYKISIEVSAADLKRILNKLPAGCEIMRVQRQKTTGQTSARDHREKLLRDGEKATSAIASQISNIQANLAGTNVAIWHDTFEDGAKIDSLRPSTQMIHQFAANTAMISREDGGSQ